ncbi:MAG: deoxyguanosinetriphosphate triphosphohydrolase, partial [Alphaproteobacteria bacterium]
ASLPHASRGRLHPEDESTYRSPFQRDRDRVIHCSAFRRLKHKTQVFVYHEGDHYRTRLTHTLEVAQIARTIGRGLGLNEDLAEAVALAHDFGHTPFGHAGEEALDAAMAPYGGFDHNAQALRILTKLEQRYAEFDGLNLTWETLEGVVKHNGPVEGPLAPADRTVPAPIADYVAEHDLELHTYPGAEAQVAALADDIAYISHDVDDGIRAGLFEISQLMPLPLVGTAFEEVTRKYQGLDRTRLVHEAIRRMIGEMVSDVLVESRKRLAAERVETVDDIRGLSAPVAAFSETMSAADRATKAFLFEHMYRHYRVNRMTHRARLVVSDLFAIFHGDHRLLPDEWQARADGRDEAGRARVVADYIAGMTDGYALDTHRQLLAV